MTPFEATLAVVCVLVFAVGVWALVGIGIDTVRQAEDDTWEQLP